MFKKVVLCGAVLLAFGDAHCMRGRHARNPFAVRIRGNGADARPVWGGANAIRNYFSLEQKQVVIDSGNRWREQNPGRSVPWRDLLEGTGIDPNWASRYYKDRKLAGTLERECPFRNYIHSRDQKQVVIDRGNRWREQNPGRSVPWGELLRDTGIDPNWASGYYGDRKCAGTLGIPVAPEDLEDPVAPDDLCNPEPPEPPEDPATWEF